MRKARRCQTICGLNFTEGARLLLNEIGDQQETGQLRIRALRFTTCMAESHGSGSAIGL